jgi:signal transduction histidine kinase
MGAAKDKFIRFLQAEEEEAKRVARSLRHNLAQSLSTVRFDLSQATRQLRENQVTKGIEAVEATIPGIQQAIEQVEEIGMHLRPPTLDDIGLSATLPWFCREFQKSHPGFDAALEINVSDDEIPRFLNYVIYKIVRETLDWFGTNGKPGLIRLSLLKRDARIELTIRDKDQGFDMEKDALTGSGLMLSFGAIKQLAEIAGGSCALESAVGAGTVICVSFPL